MNSHLKNITLHQGAGLIALACAGMLAFGLYLQHVVGLNPCPMCIVQRYALTLIAIAAGLAWFLGKGTAPTAPAPLSSRVLAGLAVLFSVAGACVAARQSWLQWYPPEQVSCGRDFYGMLEVLPLKRAFPMIFRGSGDCSKVDWTLFGGSLANWSFVCFVAMALVLLVLFVRRAKA